LRELKVRTGPKPKDRIGRPSEMTDKEWWDFKETYKMKFRLRHKKGRRPNLHHICKVCKTEFLTAEFKRDHQRRCKIPEVIQA